ncbi:MAG: flagellar biosynthesis protein FlhF [Lachnospiraceae bacterium]|nr:flagellar biosynthesis protein FlhF [Lachnospiraceae bacterium]
MIIKKFVGKNEEEATSLAKKDLGENLVIMNVRKVKAKPPFAFLKSKRVEVTAAIEEEDPAMVRIRKIARAQDSAQSKAANTPESVTAKPAQETSGTAQQVSSSASAPLTSVGISPDEKSKSIEEKLDNLQNMLEKKLGTGEGAKPSEKPVQTPAEKPVAEKAVVQPQEPDRETSRFLRLLYNTMIDNDIDEKYVNELVSNADKAGKPGAKLDHYLSAVYQKMILRFGKADGISEPAGKGPVVVFFIGPTGVGKTTTIAKVASSLSVNDKKKVALLTTDTYRIAAADQLRTYASILEVPFRVIYSEDELLIACDDFRDCDYILVDTAGHSHKSEELLARQKAYMACLPETFTKQCFLVVSATTKYKDLKKIVDNYKTVSEFQLIFTKLDETSTLGSLYNIRCYSESPIAFVTCGQNVPDDIETFNAQRIVKQLLGGE